MYSSNLSKIGGIFKFFVTNIYIYIHIYIYEICSDKDQDNFQSEAIILQKFCSVLLSKTLP